MPVMVMMAFMLMSVFFMLVMVMMMAAAPMIVVVIVIMVVVMMVMFVFVMIVVIMMVVMAAAIVVIVIIVILMGSLDHLGQLLREGILVVHGLENLLAGELIPWRGDDNGVLIVLTQQSNGGCELFLTDRAGAAENDAGRSFDLVAVKFPEVFQVNFALCGVCDSDEAAEADIRSRNALHRTDHVAELAYAGRLNEDAVGLIICDDLRQRTAKVAHERAADAAGVHLVDLDACLLHEAAVDADLTEFVLNENELFAAIGFADHFFDERGLAGAEKTGKNINCRHL